MTESSKHIQLAAFQNKVPDDLIFGRTPLMQLARQKVESLSGTNTPVLIQGESGTGKEVLAAAIHSRCCSKDGPFVKITCPAIPASLLGDELFGWERVEALQHGTLLFDEIAELHPTLQAKLLQYIEGEQFSRATNHEERESRVQVICTTHRDLETEAAAERFRQDLLYRINVVTIDLLPLRQRTEDIPQIAAYLLRACCARRNAPLRTISAQLIDLMRRYSWPGNIRELENLIWRFVILDSEQAIVSELLAKVSTEFHAEEISGNVSLKKLTRQAAFELERRVILKALENNGWNRKRAARSLNISYRALLYKIKQGGMPPKRNFSSGARAQASSDD